ncbi:DUF5359 family protein [Paenibacillus campinasensis]|nr:DUF5359 family protein [Paenibacillus campinasensis]
MRDKLETTRTTMDDKKDNRLLDKPASELFDRFGSVLLRMLVCLLVALISLQLLLHYKPARPYVSPVDQLEGVPLDEQNVKDWMMGNIPSLLHHSS